MIARSLKTGEGEGGTGVGSVGVGSVGGGKCIYWGGKCRWDRTVKITDTLKGNEYADYVLIIHRRLREYGIFPNA